MKIALNTRFLLPGKMEGIGWFVHEIFSRLVKTHPEVEFHFLFDRKFDTSFVYADNVIPHVVFPPARHPVLWKWWFEYSLPGKLKHIRPDLFISPDGFCSLRSKSPTLMVIHDLAFEHFPEHVPTPARKFYQTYTPKYARRAEHIVAVSASTKNDLIHRYQIEKDKITVIGNAAGEDFRALPPEAIREIRNKYSKGQPYFLFVSALQPRKNLVRLMKAYERFRQQTECNTKLLVAGAHTWAKTEIGYELDKLSFRDDIIFTGHLHKKELLQIMAAALALTYVSLFEGFGIPILEAMQCHVPVITSNVSSMPEVAGDAALLIDPYSIEKICEAMERLHQDDNLRLALIEKGKAQCLKYSWQQSAEKMWEVIYRLVSELK